MIRSDRKLTLLYAVSDLATLILVFSGFHIYFHGTGYLNDHLLYLSTIVLTWFFITSRNKLYYVNLHSSLKVRFKKDLRSHLLFTGALSLFFLVLNVPSGYTREQFLAPLITFPVLDVIINFLLYRFVISMRKSGKNVRKVLIVGNGKAGKNIEAHFTGNPDLGYRVIGFLSDESINEPMGAARFLGGTGDFDQLIKTIQVDEMIISLPTQEEDKILRMVERADYHGIRVRLIPDFSQLLGRKYKTNTIGDMTVVNVREISLDQLRFAALKRSCDLIFSITMLILLSPVFIVLGLLIRLESKGPVFYCPTRLGKGGKPFRLYKFRSMYQNDTTGTKSTTQNDPRVTRIGKIIRKYNLDELPQFINVVLGQMSVVGPRPHRVFLNEMMQREVDMYMVRHYLKPGITGWAQVNGWRGPTETKEQKDNRTACDLWYVENWTPFLDMKIIFLTVFGEKTYKAAF